MDKAIVRITNFIATFPLSSIDLDNVGSAFIDLLGEKIKKETKRGGFRRLGKASQAVTDDEIGRAHV